MAAEWARWIGIVLALCGAPATADDVTLTARNGSISLSGSLSAYDGEVYKIDTEYGLLTVAGQGVICSGPGCPDLIAPRAVIRIVGDVGAGERLVLPLLAAFAASQGYHFDPPQEARLTSLIRDPKTDQVLAEVTQTATDPLAARGALASGRAELAVSLTPEPGLRSRVLALDALVAIVAPDNPLPQLSTRDLARALGQEVTNWVEVGGPDMPIVLHALGPEGDFATMVSERLGSAVLASVWHPDAASLASAVAADPWALALVAKSANGSARILPLTDSCGFALAPTALAVRSNDYPLVFPVLFLAPQRRLPLIAREFLEFLSTEAADRIVADAGFVGRGIERYPLIDDGQRLANAIRSAEKETDLKSLVAAMAGTDRLSLNFRFEEGTSDLDAQSQDNITELARLIGAGLFRQERLIFAGFSDGSGPIADNQVLSLSRAGAVLAALQSAAPDLGPDLLPVIEGYGEALPMACDETELGQRLNRRVELWVRPVFPPAATDIQAPEN
jgi:phosphate transport system substrate-binding protein